MRFRLAGREQYCEVLSEAIRKTESSPVSSVTGIEGCVCANTCTVKAAHALHTFLRRSQVIIRPLKSGLIHGSANYDPQAKSGLPPVFV